MHQGMPAKFVVSGLELTSWETVAQICSMSVFLSHMQVQLM